MSEIEHYDESSGEMTSGEDVWDGHDDGSFGGFSLMDFLVEVFWWIGFFTGNEKATLVLSFVARKQ